MDRSDLTLEEFLNLSDLATARRQMDEEVDMQLSPQREIELIDTLVSSAKERGEILTTDQARYAVRKDLKNRFGFTPPKDNFGTSLAKLYVNRVALGLKVGLPFLVASIALGSGYLLKESVKNAALRRSERVVEERVEGIYQDQLVLSNRISLARKDPVQSKLLEEEGSQVAVNLTQAQTSLTRNNDFFERYCPQGVSDEVVTPENFESVSGNLNGIENNLNVARELVRSSEMVLTNRKKMFSLEDSLERSIARIRALDPVDHFEELAETRYELGMAAVAKSDLKGAEESQRALNGIREDIVSYSDLTSKVDVMYDVTKEIAKGKDAKERLEELHRSANQYERSFDVSGLSDTFRQMTDLAAVLNQEYALTIVNKPGVRSGEIRLYNGNHSGNYIIVEAIGRDGRPIPQNIKNEETGRVDRVTRWGEEVSQARWDVLVADKEDNGKFDTNGGVIGKKEKGYLAPEITMSGFLGDKITRGEGW